jgi:hypothetical protein
MGPNQSKNWSGQELEDLIKDVVECTLDLMEMAEIENDQYPDVKVEEKIFLLTGYLFGCLIIDADAIEIQQKKENIETRKPEWLSEMRIVRQLLATYCFRFDQFEAFYTKVAIDALGIVQEN